MRREGEGGREGGRVVVASSTLSPIMLSPARNGTLQHSTLDTVHSVLCHQNWNTELVSHGKRG